MISPIWRVFGDGVANDFHFVSPHKFESSGAGLVMVETTTVEPRRDIKGGSL